MKLGIISDVHANYPALQTVHQTVGSEIDGYVFAGDLVGLYGYPAETLKFIKSNTLVHIKGNHDVAVVSNHEGHVNSTQLSNYEYRTTMSELSKSQKSYIQNMKTYKEWNEKNMLVAHAEPYPESSSGMGTGGVNKGNYTKIASELSDKYDYVVLGHTHNQAYLDCSKFGHDVTIINPGSVGQPMGKANFSVLDTRTGYVQEYEKSYDTNDLTSKIKSLDVPKKWW